MVHFLFSFKGRINRLTYWVSCLFKIPLYGVLLQVFYTAEGSDGFLLLVMLVLLAVLYIETAISVKRLHDANISGWNMLWALFPILGALCLFIICGFSKDPESNKYGDPPESVVIPLIKDILSLVPLIPKIVWRFTLNRVREIGKAFRGEDNY